MSKKPTIDVISVSQYLEYSTKYGSSQGVRRALREGRISDLDGVISFTTIGNQYALTVDKNKIK